VVIHLSDSNPIPFQQADCYLPQSTFDRIARRAVNETEISVAYPKPEWKKSWQFPG
jgi:hypothetical protein